MVEGLLGTHTVLDALCFIITSVSLYSFARATITKDHKLRSLNNFDNRNVFPPIPEARHLRPRSILGLEVAIFSLFSYGLPYVHTHICV